MTAVAPPPNFQPISRPGWNAPNGAPNGLNSMNADEFRMFMPRKSAQRPTSSTSLASSASSNSTISATSAQTNGVSPSPAGDGATWGARKKPPRGLWPASKAEPISGLSTARPQSIASTSGPSAASAISALHSPSPMLPSNGQSQAQQNGAPRTQGQSENTAILHLIPMNGTFERKTITVPFYPEVLRIGRQTNNKTIPTPLNGYFDSKVLSRQHAEIWADRNGKIWIRDVKSSNGTFVNGQRLSQENRDSDPHELREQDMLELGIDIVSEDQKTIVHHKVAARVEHAGIYTNAGNNMMDLNFGDLDSPSLGNIISPGGPTGMGGIRGRNGSTGSLNGGRLQTPSSAVPNNMSGMGQQRQMNFWLQPVTMEQVVKKLNGEIKQARQQSQDLQRTSQYLDTVLFTEQPKKESTKASPSSNVRSSPFKSDLKTRFTDPPAPPPQQPLPEKPDAHQPILRRTDTERPKTHGSPIRGDSPVQVSSLAEALNNAKKELESQSHRLKDLETMLAQERMARESAEERAQRLEVESRSERPDARETDEGVNLEPPTEALVPEDANGAIGEKEDIESTIVDTESADSRLQQRLDRMLVEMNEMKQQMETYRQRAESAEADSARDRKTLAEMIEQIRQDDAERVARDSKKQRRLSDTNASKDNSPSALDGAEDNGDLTIMNQEDGGLEGAGFELLKRVGLENGRPVTPEKAIELGKIYQQSLATRSSRHNEALLLHGGPAASLFGVVLVGIGLMAWLNSYPKVER